VFTTVRRAGRLGLILKAGNAVAALIPAFGAGVVFAAPAIAGPAPEVARAVASARGGAPCGPLNYNSRVEQAADIVNRSTFTYLAHTAENVPADSTHPTAIVKDVGIDTTKVISLQGAGHVEGDAIKGLLLEGRDAIPDCTYTDFGASHLYEPESDYNLVVTILVGK
jgi:hypothetical protein